MPISADFNKLLRKLKSAPIVLSAAVISHFSSWDIPYITANLVPYLKDEAMMFYAGLFLLIGNAIWLVIFPFAE